MKEWAIFGVAVVAFASIWTFLSLMLGIVIMGDDKDVFKRGFFLILPWMVSLITTIALSAVIGFLVISNR